MHDLHARLERLTHLVRTSAIAEGVTRTAIGQLGVFKLSTELDRSPEIETPAIVIVLNGTKNCFVGGQLTVNRGPCVLVGLYPIPVETQIIDATQDDPFLAVGIELDVNRLAAILLRLGQVGDQPLARVTSEPAAKFSLDLTAELIEPFIRLFEMLDNSQDISILADGTIDEIYYRLLTSDRGPELRSLLDQSGKIKRVARAIDHIHTHLDEQVSVERLAESVHMSRTAFFAAFKDVVRLSPLQYAKSVKLLEAQKLIQSGRGVSESSRMVGYNNLGQFSREYKRHFGHPPSASRNVGSHLD